MRPDQQPASHARGFSVSVRLICLFESLRVGLELGEVPGAVEEDVFVVGDVVLDAVEILAVAAREAYADGVFTVNPFGVGLDEFGLVEGDVGGFFWVGNLGGETGEVAG